MVTYQRTLAQFTDSIWISGGEEGRTAWKSKAAKAFLLRQQFTLALLRACFHIDAANGLGLRIRNPKIQRRSKYA